MARKPTIWEALAARLGREPTNAEANAEVRRILAAEYVATDTQGRRTPPCETVEAAIDAGVAAEISGDIGSDWWVDTAPTASN
jgi:hypothetical protein